MKQVNIPWKDLFERNKNIYKKVFEIIQAPDTRDLGKRTDYDTKIGEIEKKIYDHNHSNKYFTTQEFIMLTSENFAASVAKAKIATKDDVTDFVKKIYFDDK